MCFLPFLPDQSVDCEKSGMADMVFEMIQDADIDTRAEYYKHIVLSGTHSSQYLYNCLLQLSNQYVQGCALLLYCSWRIIFCCCLLC